MFWFTVDMPRGEELVTDIRSAEELQGLRVLAVDPNQTNLTVLEHYLSSWGIDCHTCAGALQALDALEEASDAGRPFDLAILDLDMPEMDGLELARAIRGRPDLRELRLLLLGDSGVDVEGYPEAGISSALTKPAHQSALRAAISEATARSAGRPAPPRPAQSDPVDRGLQVLVVEDNQVNSTIACALLAKSGLQSVLAGNGREAVEMARTHELAAILMDCQMPELDGFEASREIRKAENGHRVPIIAMTALTMPGDRERCIAAGMDDYLTKPLRVAELRSSIQRWIPAECSEEPLYDASDPRAVADVTVSGDHDATLDSTTLAELRRTLSAAVRMQLMDTFEAQAKRSVEEIATAAARGDNGALRRAAHLLKGSAASLGATRLQQGCQRAEHTGRDGDREVGEEELRELGALVAEACVALRERFV